MESTLHQTNQLCVRISSERHPPLRSELEAGFQFMYADILSASTTSNLPRSASLWHENAVGD